ncbi:hypothetical protein Pan54_41320 [Rubinisphaera italica]|uniref:Uncharacterized protein n=1 Tax=Rubinisphaera italica TaxID=2527969 RepID=A0A5C5XLF8_9PLAN|nr:hypothetical protein Pan54_41320 [Rubinisphaera italica]
MNKEAGGTSDFVEWVLKAQDAPPFARHVNGTAMNVKNRNPVPCFHRPTGQA